MMTKSVAGDTVMIRTELIALESPGAVAPPVTIKTSLEGRATAAIAWPYTSGWSVGGTAWSCHLDHSSPHLRMWRSLLTPWLVIPPNTNKAGPATAVKQHAVYVLSHQLVHQSPDSSPNASQCNWTQRSNHCRALCSIL